MKAAPPFGGPGVDSTPAAEATEPGAETLSSDPAVSGPPVLSIENLGFPLRAFRLQLSLACRNWPLVLLGPSGAGKTVLLRLLAGLERPESGRIRFGQQTWFDGPDPGGKSRSEDWLPAYRRPIGYCLQEALLFPHLNVLENVMYPLNHLRPRPTRSERAGKAMAELNRWGAAHLASARPAGLSGGEQGRIALARAFVRSPELLLLDEPFAALDPPSREALLAAVLAELRERTTPVIWVTHDRAEAVTLGGTLVVILEGKVAQAGAPEDVFHHPASPAVASFLGSGSVLHGFVQAREGGMMRIRCGPVLLRAAGNLPPGMAVVATIRSEEIELALPEGSPEPGERRHPARASARNEFPARIVSIRPFGFSCLVELDAGILLTAAVTRASCEELALAPEMPVLARIKALGIQVRSEAWGTGPAGPP